MLIFSPDFFNKKILQLNILGSKIQDYTKIIDQYHGRRLSDQRPVTSRVNCQAPLYALPFQRSLQRQTMEGGAAGSGPLRGSFQSGIWADPNIIAWISSVTYACKELGALLWSTRKEWPKECSLFRDSNVKISLSS